ncbi:S-adenosyl-L-methionine-dependent methyltransferase [Pseudomassariella vexata]|uniref:S-adenosyl-L-methionine-dependent methyltransferase n=1 Tax=Pseudomassariella vexata TaxID=1141098 RepID=A0A1Y2DIC4_9PEZI|nr:S-adenosyl-L-methionine-dependent methyltransferase [Pseudomassariella vexata]ORY58896.1 S-adenosyl-L-methionine-dependent methyltransferase [Pseudomassariella vexata]
MAHHGGSDPDGGQDEDMEGGDEGFRPDSAVDIAISYGTGSVDPAVYEFIEENGRTYHSYKAGRYLLPNDEREYEREALEHQLFLLAMDNEYYFSPVGELHNVLDVGTGTGLWAIEMAELHPSAHVIGTDLSPIQPDFVPVNCHFEIDDAEDQWVYPQKFDLIHFRSCAYNFLHPQSVIHSAADALSLNGWVEVQDYMFPLRCDDGSWDGTALQRWSHLISQSLLRAGRPFYSEHWGAMFRAAGLVDVREERFFWPLNAWPKGEENKDIGRICTINTQESLESVGMAILTRYGGMPLDEVMRLTEEAKCVVSDIRCHVYLPVTVVMGRRA